MVGLDINAWERHIPQMGEIPSQTNGVDCGMFMLEFARHIAANQPFDWDVEDMPAFRRRLAAELVNKDVFTMHPL